MVPFPLLIATSRGSPGMTPIAWTSSGKREERDITKPESQATGRGRSLIVVGRSCTCR